MDLRNRLGDSYSCLNTTSKCRFGDYLKAHKLIDDKKCQDLFDEIVMRHETNRPAHKEEVEYILGLLTTFITERRLLMPDKCIFE